MTKRNPYPLAKTSAAGQAWDEGFKEGADMSKQEAYLMGLSDGSRQRYEEGHAAGKAKGIILGERRLARALRRWANDFLTYQDKELLESWLKSREKRGKK